MRIPRFISRSLVIEAIIIILLASITPALIVGYLTFSGAKEALQKAELDSLCTARDRGKEAIQDYLDESVRDLRLLARTWSVRHVCKTLPILGVEWQKSEQVAETLNSAKYKGLTADINDVLNSWLNLYESDNAYHDVLIILGRERGRVMYTQKRGADFGAVLDPQADSSSPLARLWSRVVETQKTVMVDFSHYDPIRGVAAFIGTPVRHEQGALIGVLVVRIGTERIDRIMKGIAQIAKTGNAFIFGNDLLLRSNDRFHDASILKRKVGFKEARAALEGKSGIGEMVNREGVAHLIAWSPVGLKGRKNLGSDFDWAIVGEVASTEAFGPVYTLRTRAILITISIGLLLSGIVFLITRPTVSTVVRLSDQASRITEGDLTTEVPSSERADEIGVLARNFRQMVGNLREQTGAFLKGITTLKSSASTIAQTVSHLADSTSSTSGAVTETFATVEQTKQAAQLSSEKANKVLADSMNSVQISEGGRQATSATILKMNAIKANVASIGETVLRLSEQSRAISDIAVAAQDLADQSNLLAVNASIEAARAGEQGKGFAVVAQEIKSLADQSKAATQQIRSIIEETGKWVEAVVVATKGGGAAVDEGVSQSMAAGEAIEALAKSVQEASMAVTVIDSTTKQQFSGMNQISDAMTHIDESMKRNLLATDELGTLARELEALSAKLDQLMGRYKV